MNTSLIKELRDLSGAGLMDCKKALEASNNDIDEAIDYLRKKEENTRDGVISKAMNQAIEQLPYYHSYPSFIGSQKAFVEGGEIIKSVLYLDKKVDATFKAAIKECQYAAS